MAYTKFAVVAGHNAIVPGASGNGYKEHEVARQMAAKVLEYLEAVGVTAYDCTDDVGTTQTQCWTNAVNNTNAAIGSDGLAISIHLNSGGGTGTEVLYYDQATLAGNVSSAVSGAMGISNRGAKQRTDIGYLNSTYAPAILIELCFIDSATDMQKLMANFDKVAEAIVETVTGKTLGGINGVVKVLVDGLNIRTGPSTSEQILGQAVKDQLYNVVWFQDGWYKIITSTYQGWVYGNNGTYVQRIS